MSIAVVLCIGLDVYGVWKRRRWRVATETRWSRTPEWLPTMPRRNFAPVSEMLLFSDNLPSASSVFPSH